MTALSKYRVGTVADWRAVGITERQLRSLVRQGILVRMHHGVYATATALAESKADPAHEHALLVAAAMAATGRDAVASHQSAALMDGIQLLKRPPAGMVMLTRTGATRSGHLSRSRIKVHTGNLPADHTTERFRIPVTTATRTVADLARTSSFMAAVVAADSALRQSKATKPGLASVLSSCAGWPGLAQARRVVEFSDELSESVLESCARVVFDRHGLPPPELQVELGAERFAGRVDFYWREYLTVAEADGEIKYSKAGRASAQLERDQLLRAAGFRVIHFTWQQLLYEQLLVISWIRRAFSGEIG